MKKKVLFGFLLSSILVIGGCSADNSVNSEISVTTIDESITSTVEENTEIATESEEKTYNELTTLVYKDHKIDLSNCSHLEWNKFKQELKLDSDVLENTLKPYETLSTLYNPYNKEIEGYEAKLLEVRLLPEDIKKIPEDCYMFNGDISFHANLSEIENTLKSKGFEWENGYYITYLENGQKFSVKPDHVSGDVYIYFEFSPYYE